MEGNLLELVNDAEKNPISEMVGKVIDQSKEDAAIRQAAELIALGMLKAGEKLAKKAMQKRKLRLITEGKYIAITPKHISNFLKKKADAFNLEWEKKNKKDESDPVFYGNSFGFSDRWQAELDEIYRQRLDNIRMGSEFSIYPQTNTYKNWARSAAAINMVTPDTIRKMIDRLAREGSQMRDDSIKDALLYGASALQLNIFTSDRTHIDIPAPQAISPNSWFATGAEELNDSMSQSLNNGDRLEWSEVVVSKYGSVPPAHALAKLKEEKGKEVFDYFTIASVKYIKDPVLLGRVKDSDVRYFLAQWDNDITLDELL